ncbi:hypothetical protein KJ664_02010 [Patescibacteria group bacterium]|nr:hypothetical protein [Patescibacteria group bacterium]
MAQKIDKFKYNRRSIRLKEYDYSQNGWYFVTICTQNRKCLFGEIPFVGADQCVCPNPVVRLNTAGNIVNKWWLELKNKFTNVELDEYVVMPNHIHGIINIVSGAHPLGAHPLGAHPLGAHTGAPLQEIIQWFKTMSTNEYIRLVKSGALPPFEKSVWQRNYYEHIIRTKNELNRIQFYIKENPAMWERDRNNLLGKTT